MSVANEPVQYDDSNRAFLQAFFARGSLTLKEAKPILAEIFSVQDGKDVPSEDVTEADLRSYVAAANSAISEFDYEIRSTYPQTSRDHLVWAIVNTTSDPLTQLSTTLSPDEISFFKRVLDAIFETNNTLRAEIFAVTEMAAVNLGRAAGGRRETQNGSMSQGNGGNGITVKQAETILKNLVESGWLDKSKESFLTLSPRGLMELKQYLLATYNDPDVDEENKRIKECTACTEIITIGQRCAQRDCPCRIHDTCAVSFFRSQKNKDPCCPICKHIWTGRNYVGQKALTESEAYQKGRRRSKPSMQASQREVEEDVAANERTGAENGSDSE